MFTAILFTAIGFALGRYYPEIKAMISGPRKP